MNLPVLPLNSGVLLAGMVVTIALETPEAIAAADAAGGGRLLVVPREGRRYASVGTVAEIEDESSATQCASRFRLRNPLEPQLCIEDSEPVLGIRGNGRHGVALGP